jgi:hypothetical protein
MESSAASKENFMLRVNPVVKAISGLRAGILFTLLSAPQSTLAII